jgi:hypothetical protein
MLVSTTKTSACFFRFVESSCLNPSPSLSEPSTRLSLERAREYDRVSEWLARNKPSNKNEEEASLGYPMDQVGRSSSDIEYGIEGRRAQFDKDSYRQPVLTQKPLRPKNYRRGQPDAEAEMVRRRLRELQGYDLMEDGCGGSASGFKRDNAGGPATIPEGSEPSSPEVVTL